MNRLKNTRAYLVGAIDRCADKGVGWRKQIKLDLSDLGIFWLDPTQKPINIGVEDDESRQLRREAKLLGNYRAVAAEMTPIRKVDRRMVNISDFLIVNIDIQIHACGTYDEFALANSQDKPILVHVEQGKSECPDWIFACIDERHIFGTWAELIRYVRHIAHDNKVDLMGRWLFFDWTGE